MPKIKALLVLCTLTALCGCLKPHYIPPCLDLPQEWRLQGDEGSTLGNCRWWEQFEDPVLNDLITAALQNNQDLKVAIKRVLEFSAQLGITNAALYPEVSLSGSYTRYELPRSLPTGPLPGYGRVFNDYLGLLNFSWALDFWGKARSASEASYADLLGSVEARRAVVITVVSSVASAYIGLRELDAQLHISKETLQTRRDALMLATHRFEAGETSELEVKQAESEVETAAILVIQFERDIPKQENLLSILVGENPRRIERGRTIEAFQYPLVIPAGLPSDLLQRRPDIIQAEESLIAANARITEAKALFFPQISLTGDYGKQSDTLSLFLSNPAEMWQYGLSFTQLIFNAGKTVSQVKLAKAQREEALYTYFQTILTAFREVEDALITYRKNRELVLENHKQVKVLGEYKDLAQLRYNEGETDYLNVLDAERQLLNAQLELVQAQANSFIAVVQLYSALGGGWVYDADNIAIYSP